jgi:hypothetical protein
LRYRESVGSTSKRQYTYVTLIPWRDYGIFTAERLRTQMSRYEYSDRPPTGGWIMEVRKGPVHVGNVRKNRTTGRYQFFRGKVNAIRPVLEEPVLEVLLEEIEKLDL